MSKLMERPKPFQAAATASWGLFILAIAVNTAFRSILSPIVADLVGLSLLLTGFALGAFALFGISRHGRKGILIPAIIGLVLNGLVTLVWVTNFLAALDRARGHA